MIEEPANWTDRCPGCGKTRCLKVIEATLTATGATIYPGSDLMAEGFEVDPWNELSPIVGKDFSTEDEIVLCIRCRREYPLEEFKPKSKEYRVVWQVDVAAISPEDAAKAARCLLLDRGSTAVVFDVYDHQNDHKTTVDLAEEHGDG